MNLHVDANALELTINDAIKEMKQEEAEGFDYKIGEVCGMDLRIVVENKNAGSVEIIVNDGPLNITAVIECED